VFSEIFVPSEQTFAIELLTERFIKSQKRKVLLLIGEYNIGKTTMMKNFYSKLSK
jgi:tRNA A37 threonylcarbamoyladenosine biosynthesis protein TsaE